MRSATTTKASFRTLIAVAMTSALLFAACGQTNDLPVAQPLSGTDSSTLVGVEPTTTTLGTPSTTTAPRPGLDIAVELIPAPIPVVGDPGSTPHREFRIRPQIGTVHHVLREEHAYEAAMINYVNGGQDSNIIDDRFELTLANTAVAANDGQLVFDTWIDRYKVHETREGSGIRGALTVAEMTDGIRTVSGDRGERLGAIAQPTASLGAQIDTRNRMIDSWPLFGQLPIEPVGEGARWTVEGTYVDSMRREFHHRAEVELQEVHEDRVVLGVTQTGRHEQQHGSANPTWVTVAIEGTVTWHFDLVAPILDLVVVLQEESRFARPTGEETGRLHRNREQQITMTRLD